METTKMETTILLMVRIYSGTMDNGESNGQERENEMKTII